MTNYLELAQLSDGSIVLRRSDDKDNPLVKIHFSKESMDLLQGQQLHIAKEMIRAGIESINGDLKDFDDFFDSPINPYSKWLEGQWKALNEWTQEFNRIILPIARSWKNGCTIKVLK